MTDLPPLPVAPLATAQPGLQRRWLGGLVGSLAFHAAVLAALLVWLAGGEPTTRDLIAGGSVLQISLGFGSGQGVESGLPAVGAGAPTATAEPSESRDAVERAAVPLPPPANRSKARPSETTRVPSPPVPRVGEPSEPTPAKPEAPAPEAASASAAMALAAAAPQEDGISKTSPATKIAANPSAIEPSAIEPSALEPNPSADTPSPETPPPSASQPSLTATPGIELASNASGGGQQLAAVHPFDRPGGGASAEGQSGVGAGIGGTAAGWSYYSGITRKIERNLRYPRRAQRERIEGIVLVSVEIDRGGRVLHTNVANSSGSRLLDRDALRTVERAAPFGAVPSDIRDTHLAFDIPVTYEAR